MVSGPLGSGKATLLLHALKGQALGERIAVLVDELGEIGFDGEIWRGDRFDLIQIASGCICCTLQSNLI